MRTAGPKRPGTSPMPTNKGMTGAKVMTTARASPQTTGLLLRTKQGGTNTKTTLGHQTKEQTRTSQELLGPLPKPPRHKMTRSGKQQIGSNLAGAAQLTHSKPALATREKAKSLDPAVPKSRIGATKKMLGLQRMIEHTKTNGRKNLPQNVNRRRERKALWQESCPRQSPNSLKST